MKVTEETRKYWEERSAAILDAYQKGLISTEDPIQKARIEWAKETTTQKEAALQGCDGIIDRWQAETDAMSEEDRESKKND